MFGKKKTAETDFRPMIQRLTEDLSDEDLEKYTERAVRAAEKLQKQMVETEKDLSESVSPGKMIAERYMEYTAAWEAAVGRSDMFLVALAKRRGKGPDDV